MNGNSIWDDTGNKLDIELQVQDKGTINFYIKIWKSKEFYDKKPNDAPKRIKDKCVYIIETRQVSGNNFVYQQIKQEYILKKWSPWTMGLPKWALKLQKQKEYKDTIENNHEDYFSLMVCYFMKYYVY